MSVDIFLDPLTNDIDITNGTMRITSSVPESSRQQVQIDLATFKGEWFANILSGLPYLSRDRTTVQLMGQSEVTNFDIAIKGSILGRENITSISAYTSTFDRKQRELVVSFTAVTNTGEEVEVNNLLVGI